MFWKVTDRWSNEIILTEERWHHICEGHWELADRLEQVLATIRDGRREQAALDPSKYRYWHEFPDLPAHYTRIVVIVRLARNKFVITAYPK